MNEFRTADSWLSDGRVNRHRNEWTNEFRIDGWSGLISNSTHELTI